MELSTQTHFRQGWNTRLIDDIQDLGISSIRDSIAWHKVETKQGQYDFSHNSATWVTKALDAGLDVLLVFASENRLYDNGTTVHSQKGLAGFADFVVATLQKFPGVTAIEIGNEYNGSQFVSGKVANASKQLRDDYYKKTVVAVHEALEEAGIDVKVLGGATHSIPVDYIGKLEANGTIDLLDGVSIHPYSTEPEQFADQLEVLRNRIGDDVEIHVTEFADSFATPEEAPAYLAKMVSIMAATGVETANWYAFARQSAYPNMELFRQGIEQATLAGVTFSILEELLAEQPVVAQVPVDGQTYFYTFGDNAAILWGEPRQVELADGVKAYDLAGNQIEDFASISPDMPVLLRSDGPVLADSVEFGSNYLLADSFHDFDVTTVKGDMSTFEGPWSYFVQNGKGKEFAVETDGGDIGGGQSWTPYLGFDGASGLRINSQSVVPDDLSRKNKPGKDFSTVERFTADDDGMVTIRGSWNVANHSKNGVRLTIQVNEETIVRKDITNKSEGYEFDLELTGISLEAGDTIDFIISSRNNSVGDVVSRRIQIFEDDVPFAADHVPVSYAPTYPAQVAEPALPVAENRFDKSDASSKVTLKGSGGEDLIIGGSGNDALRGKGGADDIMGGQGKDDLRGEKGADKLYGGAGADNLRGGKGTDLLDGGTGDDRLEGGAGRDTFLFGDDFGRDTIVDFRQGDRIDLSDLGQIDEFADLEIQYRKKVAIISIGDDQIRLENFKSQTLDEDDFLF